MNYPGHLRSSQQHRASEVLLVPLVLVPAAGHHDGGAPGLQTGDLHRPRPEDPHHHDLLGRFGAILFSSYHLQSSSTHQSVPVRSVLCFVKPFMEWVMLWITKQKITKHQKNILCCVPLFTWDEVDKLLRLVIAVTDQDDDMDKRIREFLNNRKKTSYSDWIVLASFHSNLTTVNFQNFLQDLLYYYSESNKNE